MQYAVKYWMQCLHQHSNIIVFYETASNVHLRLSSKRSKPVNEKHRRERRSEEKCLPHLRIQTIH